MPLAATLTRECVYRAFEGQENIFYYGHSYTANPLGCAVALASLDVFASDRVLERMPEKAAEFSRLLHEAFPGHIVRCRGLIAGIELRQADGSPYPPAHRMGAKVCVAARGHGLLTRPIRDTVVLMPPLCSTVEELRFAVTSLRQAVADVV